MMEYSGTDMESHYAARSRSYIYNDLFRHTTLNVISMFHRAFFNSIIDKHQHMHFTFNSILVYNVDFNVKTYKNT